MKPELALLAGYPKRNLMLLHDTTQKTGMVWTNLPDDGPLGDSPGHCEGGQSPDCRLTIQKVICRLSAIRFVDLEADEVT